MTKDRTLLCLDQMAEAARLAVSYIEGMDERDFLADTRTQKAVAMNLIVIGESVAPIVQDDPALVTKHPALPWRQMTGMRNRVAHGYFDLNMRVVWETARGFLPELLHSLQSIRTVAEGDDADPTQSQNQQRS